MAAEVALVCIVLPRSEEPADPSLHLGDVCVDAKRQFVERK